MKLRNANFLHDETLIICTSTNLVILKPPLYEPILSIPGGPFLFSTAFQNFIATVAMTNNVPHTPMYLLLYNLSNGAFLRSIEFPTRILMISSTQTHFFVALKGTIICYDIKTLQKITTLENASSKGIFAASQNYIVYPDESNIGFVNIIATSDFQVKHHIKVHNNEITKLSISNDQPILLSASKKGTLVRAASCETGETITEYRRGFINNEIVEMAQNGKLCCVCSLSTIHIYTADNQHFNVSCSSTPICCMILQDNVYVVTQSGSLTVYALSDDTKSIEIVSNIEFK